MTKTARRIALLTALTLGAMTLPIGAAGAASRPIGSVGPVSRQPPAPDPSSGPVDEITALVDTLLHDLIGASTMASTTSKTFDVTNEIAGVTGKVQGWTNPSDDPLLWLSHPAVGAELKSGASGTHVWDMHRRFPQGDESDVTYSLLNATTGGQEGQVVIHMKTSAFNVGNATCTFSGGVTGDTCTVSNADNGVILIVLNHHG